MTEKEIRIASDEYMDIPPVRAAIKIGDKEDLISHLKVAYANGMRDAIKIIHEEAVNAFEKTYLICETCNKKCSVECGEDCLKNHFIKLLGEL